MAKIYKLMILIIISLLIHELGHIIIGQGFAGFRYAPEIDPFSFRVAIENYNIWSLAGGLIFTLPLLLFRIHPKLLFLVLLIESRWDILDIMQLIM